MKKPLRIGGVPEHFNLPWQLALEKNLFAHNGIDLEWTFYAGGTGAMTNALARGDLDMAILLTEGFLSSIHDGLKAKIVKAYIETPLVWGIYTGAQSGITSTFNSVDHGITAISRPGSGSHLMALIDAEQHGVKLLPADFVTVNSLHGAVDSLVKNETQYFYWEKFMTRPFVRQGHVRLIGDFWAPWSGFLVVAGNNAIDEQKDKIFRVLELMNIECKEFPDMFTVISELSRRFEMTDAEGRQWLQSITWSTGFNIKREDLENALDALSRLGLVNATLNIENVCATWLKWM